MGKFGTKDLYEGTFIALDNTQFGDTHIPKGGVVLHITDAMSLSLQGQDITNSATGGFENDRLIDWTKIDNVQGALSAGLVDKIGMSLSLGLKLLTTQQPISIPMVEEYFVGTNGEVKLNHIPTDSVVIFEKNNGNRVRQILNFSIEENTLLLEDTGIDIEVNYNYTYMEKNEYISVGNSLLEGYFKFVGKFYYTDEVTQKQNTGIIEIPKLKFLQNVRITLGRNTTPTISDLYFSIENIGERRNKEFFKIYFLNEKL